MKKKNDFQQDTDIYSRDMVNTNIDKDGQTDEDTVELSAFEKALVELQKEVNIYYLEHPEKAQEYPDKIFVKSVDELEEKITEHIPKKIVEDEIVEKRIISKEVKVGENPLDFSLMSAVGMPKQYVNTVFQPEEEATDEESQDKRVKNNKEKPGYKSNQEDGMDRQPAQESARQYFEQITLEETELETGLNISKISLAGTSKSSGLAESELEIVLKQDKLKEAFNVEGLKNKIVKNIGEVLGEKSSEIAERTDSDEITDGQKVTETAPNTQGLFQHLLDNGNAEIETIAGVEDSLAFRDEEAQTKNADARAADDSTGNHTEISNMPAEDSSVYHNRLIISMQQDATPEERQDQPMQPVENSHGEADERENSKFVFQAMPLPGAEAIHAECGKNENSETENETSKPISQTESGENSAEPDVSQPESQPAMSTGAETVGERPSEAEVSIVKEDENDDVELTAFSKTLSKREKREQRRKRVMERRAQAETDKTKEVMPETHIFKANRDEMEKEIEEKLNAKKTQEELLFEQKKKEEAQAFAQMLEKLLHQDGEEKESDTSGAAKPERHLPKQEKKILKGIEGPKIREERLNQPGNRHESDVMHKTFDKTPVVQETPVICDHPVVQEVPMDQKYPSESEQSKTAKPEKQLSKREKRRLRDLERRRIREEELQQSEKAPEISVEQEHRAIQTAAVVEKIPVIQKAPVEQENLIVKEADEMQEMQLEKDASASNNQQTSLSENLSLENPETDLAPILPKAKREVFWKAWIRHLREWMKKIHYTKEESLPLSVAEEPAVVAANHSNRTNVIEGLVEGGVRGEYIILEIRSIIKSDVVAAKSFLCKPKSMVFGNVYAEEVIVEGTIRGNIQASVMVRIKDDGCVFGNVEAPAIVLDPMGYVAGDLTYRGK